jgi:hypothetical protein
VPGLSVAVFVLPQEGEQGIGLPVTKKDLSQMPPLGKNVIHLMGTVTRWDDLGDDTAFRFEGNGIYAIELSLKKGFYKVKTGNNADLEYGKLGAFLKVDSEVALASPGGVMNLQLAETAVYRFELDLNNLDAPALSITKK